MSLSALRLYLAAPFASLFAILAVHACVAQWPASAGIRIPMMRLRDKPLSNCAFNGFTLFVRRDGKLSSGMPIMVASRSELLSRVREARDDIWDDTIFVIADPNASYGDVVRLLADVHHAAPPDHLALVTRTGQIDASSIDPLDPVWADRCRFVWPALPEQPEWTTDHEPAPKLEKLTVWEALTGRARKR